MTEQPTEQPTNTQNSDTTQHYTPPNKESKYLIVRMVCMVLACICIILGTIGIVVPGLPTWDFYALAAIFAARASTRFHTWLYNNKIIGPTLRQWQEHRTIPLSAKIFSLVSMTIAAILLLWKVPHPIAVWIVIGIMVLVQIWLWTRKTTPKSS